MITYYQRARHLYGRLKLEVLDAAGKVIDTLDADQAARHQPRRRGRMQVKPPRVPRAAQVAFNATQGPRVVPGTYTVRLTKGADVVETQARDRPRPSRAVHARRSQAAVRRGDARPRAVRRDERAHRSHRRGSRRRDARAKALSDERRARARSCASSSSKLEDVKQKIVATKEGGAITGEERIREHLDMLYGALNGWEGRPARYQLERIDVLRRELAEVQKAFEELAAGDVRALDGALRERKLAPIPTTAALESAPGLAPDGAVAALRCLARRSVCTVPREAAAATIRGNVAGQCDRCGRRGAGVDASLKSAPGSREKVGVVERLCARDPSRVIA